MDILECWGGNVFSSVRKHIRYHSCNSKINLVLMANSRTKSLPLSMNFCAYIRISLVRFRNWKRKEIKLKTVICCCKPIVLSSFSSLHWSFDCFLCRFSSNGVYSESTINVYDMDFCTTTYGENTQVSTYKNDINSPPSWSSPMQNLASQTTWDEVLHTSCWS